jgi:HD-GYP domain-containing protein (c-di-GMP phosphodiesterase class II)
MALWLTIAAVLISVAMATATYFFEIGRVDQAIVDLAAGEARTFRNMDHDLLVRAAGSGGGTVSEEEVSARLRRFLETREVNAEGHFVLAELYDTDRRPLGYAVQEAGTVAETRLSATDHRFPDGDTPWYDKVIAEGRLYIRVVVPLHDQQARRLGYFEGAYHVADTRIASIRARLETNVALVVGVVLCTTLFLVPVIIGVNRAQLSLSRRLMRANIETLEVLGNAIAKRDSDTGAHNYRVTLFAIRLAEAVGVSSDRICGLIKGAFLHDVGKIGISDAILLKPARLTAEEFAEMQKHVAHGLDIVSRGSWLHEAADVVLYHHEKFDGSGYLRGLEGDKIPIAARIFAIADVFDALISRRPYKEPLPFEAALAIIKEGAGTHFDPVLVAAFLRIARPLYDAVVGQKDESVERMLLDLTDVYFRVVAA